nr:TolC family protein [Geotalea sp. SG265]
MLAFPLAGVAAEKVSPRQAIVMALAKNHQLQATGHELTAVEKEAIISRSRYFPRISLEENAAASNSPTRVFMMKLDQGRFAASDFEPARLNNPSSYHDFKTALNLEQPLFDLVITRSSAMAETVAESRRLAMGQKRQVVALQVYAAWLEVRRAKAYLGIAEQAMAEAREHLRLAGVRVGVGTGLKSEDLRARTFLFDVEQQLISAKNNVTLARMQLSLVTGGSSGEELDIDDGITVDGMPLNLKELQQLAVENRQDLKAIGKETEKAAAAIALARAAYYPTLYANASFQMNDYSVPFGHDNDSWQAGLSLRWDLFSGMKTANEVAKSQAMEHAAKEYQQDYRNTIGYQVSESYLRYEEAGKKLDLARQAVADAEESVRLIGKRYQNSLSTMVELLDAQTALNRARAVQVEMENGQALAVARIWQSAGVFLKEVLK